MGDKELKLRKITVCEICQSFYNKLYALQFDEVIKRNIACKVFYFTNRENEENAINREYLYEVRPYKNWHRFFFLYKEHRVYRAFAEYATHTTFDMVHAHTLFSAGFVAYLFKRKQNTKYIVSVRNVDINHFFKKRVFLRKLGNMILKNADRVVFISHSALTNIIPYLDTQNRMSIKDKSQVIPNGIDEFWLENTVEHKELNSEIRIIYYGDINQNKNVRSTIKAVTNLYQKGLSLRFIIIGKIRDSSINEYIGNPLVEIHEFIPKEELIKYIRSSDMFVMPSFSETFGLSYVEAMSQGLPIVYSKAQGFDGFFEDGTVGYAVDPQSVDEIMVAIEKIIRNYSTLSKNCISNAKDFDWKNIAERLESMYVGLEEKYK